MAQSLGRFPSTTKQITVRAIPGQKLCYDPPYKRYPAPPPFPKTPTIILFLGLGSSLLASAFIQEDDAVRKQPERVFRICKWITAPDGSKTRSVKTAGLLAPALNKDFSGAIECTARYMKWPEAVEVNSFDRIHSTNQWAFADPAILELFEIRTLRGNAKKALETPGQMVLSQRYAEKLFGSADPLGQTVMGLGGQLYTVAAIVRNPSGHSALQFDALASWVSTAEGSGMQSFPFLHNWTAQLVETFIRLQDVKQQHNAQRTIVQLLQRTPHPAGCTDLFLQPLSGKEIKTGATENAEQDRFGARVAAPAGKLVLVAGSWFL